MIGWLKRGVGELIRQAGLQVMELLMQEEVRELVGERSQRRTERTANRWGVEHGDATGGHWRETENGAEHGGLAGAVGPEDAYEFAGLNGERDAGKDLPAPQGDRHMVEGASRIRRPDA